MNKFLVKVLQIDLTSTKQTKKPKEQSRKFYVNYQVKFQEVYDDPKPWFRFQNGSKILASRNNLTTCPCNFCDMILGSGCITGY